MGRFDNMMRINAQRDNDFLSAEVERLTEKLDLIEAEDVKRTERRVAKECAEIADKNAYRGNIGDRIREAFALPRAY